MIHYLVARRHAYTMNDFLATWGKPLAGRIRTLLYEDLFSGARQRLPPATYIFTSLGRDLGARHPPSPVRSLASELHRKLVELCGPGRVLNDPARFMSRFELMRALEQRGINRFTAHRVDAAAAPRRYPVFLRREHGTLWQNPPLLRSREEYEAAVRSADPREGLIAVEYHDTAGAAGIYRKYGCFIVGGRIVPRHLFFSRNWLVKQADLCEPAMVEEELAYVASNPHAQALLEVCRMANISYGRIDYALLEGQPQIWEINITPALVSDPATDAPARRPVHERFVAQFSAALDAIDPAAG
jgi:hypothetical protein